MIGDTFLQTKYHISDFAHTTFKKFRKPMTFYDSLHHIVNSLYANHLLSHEIIKRDSVQ